MVASDDEGISRSEDAKDATKPGHSMVIGAVVRNGSGTDVGPYLIKGPVVDGEPGIDDSAMVGVVELKRGWLSREQEIRRRGGPCSPGCDTGVRQRPFLDLHVGRHGRRWLGASSGFGRGRA